jgi:hypothetical protein
MIMPTTVLSLPWRSGTLVFKHYALWSWVKVCVEIVVDGHTYDLGFDWLEYDMTRPLKDQAQDYLNILEQAGSRTIVGLKRALHDHYRNQ